MPQPRAQGSGPRRFTRTRRPLFAAWLSFALAYGCGFATLQPPSTTEGSPTTGSEKPGGEPLASNGNAPSDANSPNANKQPAGQSNVVVRSGASDGQPATHPADDALREDGPLVAQGSGGLVVVPMTGCPGADYHGRVTVGGSDFDLVLDSGSATAAIAGSSCASCGGAGRYNASTGVNLNKRITATYGSATWAGQLYSDHVAFGTSSKPASASVTVRFAAMTSQTNLLNGYHCVQSQRQQTDGILGLGPATLLAQGSTSLLSALGSAGQLAHDVFAVQTCDVGGNLTIGGYTADLVAEQPFFVPMVTNAAGAQGSVYASYYSIQLAGLRVGDVDLGLSQTQLGDTLVDNGTTLTYLPTDAYNKFVATLLGSRAIADNFDVDQLEAGFAPTLHGLSRAQLDAVLPKLGLTLTQSGGKQVMLQLDATRSYLLPGLDSAGGVHYALAVREGDGDVALVLGNAAMRQHLLIFDRAGKRIGFAAHRGCDDTPSYVGG